MLSEEYQKALMERTFYFSYHERRKDVEERGAGEISRICDFLCSEEEGYSEDQMKIIDLLSNTMRAHPLFCSRKAGQPIFDDPFEEGLIERLSQKDYIGVLADLNYPYVVYPPDWTEAFRAYCYEKIGLQVFADYFWEYADSNPFQKRPMKELIEEMITSYQPKKA